MKVLTIETSCDETAVALLEGSDSGKTTTFSVLGNTLISQIDIHREYGGVFPAMAKRAHAQNLIPILASTLEEAGEMHEEKQILDESITKELETLLSREPGLSESFLAFITETRRPDLDAICVTYGPGLEPALWVGINFAKALSLVWDVPLVAVDHMEGHHMSSLLTPSGERSYTLTKPHTPHVTLLVSGGHTELILMKAWRVYEKIGETRDDAVGEAFDKVARMMGLPYPGGPEVSARAHKDREDARTNPFTLPRPMIDSPDLDFSFSGLKTAVLYKIKEKESLTDVEVEQMARAFEDAAVDVLVKKTQKALTQCGAISLSVGGGVSANEQLRQELKKLEHTTVSFPPKELTGDNAVMIGVAGFYKALAGDFSTPDSIIATGTLSLS
jgi:N6-L-threonylcarbamoyladenine synthase